MWFLPHRFCRHDLFTFQKFWVCVDDSFLVPNKSTWKSMERQQEIMVWSFAQRKIFCMFLFERFWSWVPTPFPEVISLRYDPDIILEYYWYIIRNCKFGDLYISEAGKMFLVISNIKDATNIILHLRWCTHLKNKMCTQVLRRRELFHEFLWMMNCFYGMVDWRKVFSIISSRDYCQRSSPSRISNTPQAGFEPAQNLRSGVAGQSCTVVRTTTLRRPNEPLLLMCTLHLVLFGCYVVLFVWMEMPVNEHLVTHNFSDIVK